MNKLERNIPLLYIYSILLKRVTFPIIVVYFLSFKLSLTEISLLAAFASIITVIMEIPSGAITDNYGKKN